MIDYYETKAHPITKRMVLEAYKEIKSNGKAAGVDGVKLQDYAKDLQRNLYKLWNRMISGSYQPAMVREKRIPKKGGGTRGLGIGKPFLNCTAAQGTFGIGYDYSSLSSPAQSNLADTKNQESRWRHNSDITALRTGKPCRTGRLDRLFSLQSGTSGFGRFDFSGRTS